MSARSRSRSTSCRSRRRVPLKFGPEITTEVTCARVKMTVEDRHGDGRRLGRDAALGPVGLAQPAQLRGAAPGAAAALPCGSPRPGCRHRSSPGHPMEVGHRFLEDVLAGSDATRSTDASGRAPSRSPGWRPWSAASAFDLALHDAYGVLHGVPTYETYNARYMNADLAHYLTPAEGTRRLVRGQVSRGLPGPAPARDRSPPGTWSAARTRSTPAELTGSEPDDGYPVLLRDWIRRDGLKCLKVKLRGDDAAWDYDRLRQGRPDRHRGRGPTG